MITRDQVTGTSKGTGIVLAHTYPGLDLTVSGRPLFVGVVAMVYGKGDLGVPGVVTAGVVRVGDMGLQAGSWPPS